MQDPRKLPLWNADDTEVLPEYRLGAFHLLLDRPCNWISLALLAQCMDIGKQIYAGPFLPDKLPVIDDFKDFGTKRDAHVVTFA